MHEVGLSNLNIGIETPDDEIAKLSKRRVIEKTHQENIVNLCKKLGINVTAFFILAFENDTLESMEKTIEYAIKIDPSIARFSVSTPFPGTNFYRDLKENDMLLTEDFEQFSQFRLVYKHMYLSQDDVRKMLGSAINRFYFRPKFISRTLIKILKSYLN